MQELRPRELEVISGLKEYYFRRGLLASEVAEKMYATENTVRNWLRKYFPKEYEARKMVDWKKRPKWKDEYFLELHHIIARGGRFHDFAEAFDINVCTAREWVLMYLGQDAYDTVVRRGKEAVKAARKERKAKLIPRLEKYFLEQNLSVSEIAKELRVAQPTVRRWLREYFPQQYEVYKLTSWEHKPKWKDAYLPKLRRIVARGGSFPDVVRSFRINMITARRWVLIHLGEDVYGTLLLRAKRRPSKTKE